MSSFMAQPCVGHFEQALHIFAYLKHHDRLTLVFEEIKPTLGSQHSISVIGQSSILKHRRLFL
jgi:hypothetical protein